MAGFDSPKDGFGSLGRGAGLRFASVAAAVLSFSSLSSAAPDKTTVLGYSSFAKVAYLSFVTIGDDHWCIGGLSSKNSDSPYVQTVSMVTKAGKNKLEIAPFPNSKSFIVGSKSTMTCDYLQQASAKDKSISVFASASTVALPYLVQVLGDPVLLAWMGKEAATNQGLFKWIQETGAGVFHPIVFVN